MKLKLTVIPTILILFLTHLTALAQLEYELKTFYQSGYEDNIFRSPSSYVDRDGVVFDEESLIESGAINGFGWDVELERNFNNVHRIRIEKSGWFQRYNEQKSANQSDIDVELKYDYDPDRRFELGAEFWGSKSNRIGTNVLGEELTRVFNYEEIGTKGYLQSGLWNNATSSLELGWRYRNFQNEPGIESLTYTETAVSADFIQEFGSKSFEQFLALEIEFEDKPYHERTASDSGGYSGNPDYPLRHWRYLTGTLSYGLQLNNRWEFEPFFELRHRSDMFQNYFDYDQVGYGFKVGYDNRIVDITFDFSHKDRQYLVRTAPQASKPYPSLNYRYFRYSLDLEYQLLNTLLITGEYNLIQRRTNVSVNTMKTRRPYDFSSVLIGMELEIEGIFR